MIVYIYFKDSFKIIQKIDNITSIDDSNKKIQGDSIIIFGDSQEYIILESDTITLNIGDTIDISNLTDARDYFIKGKEIWYQEQIKKSNETISKLNQLTDMYGQTLDSIMFDILPNITTTV